MRIVVIAVGRLGRGPERTLVDRYIDRVKRSGRPAGVTAVDEIELPESRLSDRAQRVEEEGERVLSRIATGSRVILLDETGALPTSEAFARMVADASGAGTAALTLVIGGPDGHGEPMRRRAEVAVAFGRLTMPHKLVRVVLAEQIYRAVTLLVGHPYHRE